MRVRWGASGSVPQVAAVIACGVLVVAPAFAQPTEEFVPVTDAMLASPSDDDWLTWRRTTDGWGYSPLDLVNRDNVGDLRMVWTRALATGRMEGTPLGYDGVLYMPESSDVIEAIDAVTGDLIWSYRRDLPDDVYDMVGGNARGNRNIAIYDRFIVNTTDDDFAIGLDATTGELAWETQIFDYQVNPAGTARDRSSPTARRSPAGAVGRWAVRKPASSSSTTRAPARRCGVGARFLG